LIFAAADGSLLFPPILSRLGEIIRHRPEPREREFANFISGSGHDVPFQEGLKDVCLD
jgi:hypothetical protein